MSVASVHLFVVVCLCVSVRHVVFFLLVCPMMDAQVRSCISVRPLSCVGRVSLSFFCVVLRVMPEATCGGMLGRLAPRVSIPRRAPASYRFLYNAYASALSASVQSATSAESTVPVSVVFEASAGSLLPTSWTERFRSFQLSGLLLSKRDPRPLPRAPRPPLPPFHDPLPRPPLYCRPYGRSSGCMGGLP